MLKILHDLQYLIPFESGCWNSIVTKVMQVWQYDQYASLLRNTGRVILCLCRCYFSLWSLKDW